MHVDAFFFAVDGCLDDCARLHLGDFRVGVSKTAAAMSEHRIELFERVANALDFFYGNADFFSKLFLCGKLMRHELVQRRVEQADCHSESVHCLEYAAEVVALHRQQFVKSNAAAFGCARKNHLAHGFDAVALKEHVFRAAKPDTFRAEFASHESVARRIGVGAYIYFGVFVGKVHDCGKISGELCVDCRHLSVVDIAC